MDQNPPLSGTTTSSSLVKRKADDSPENLRAKFPRTIEDVETPFDDSLSADSPPTHQQRYFEARKLPYGCQYEIARLVSLGLIRYEEIETDDIDGLAKMETNEIAAPATAKSLLKAKKDDTTWERLFAKEISARSPWKELDKEEEALKTDKYMGLGVNAEVQGWYGGRVHFRAVLRDQEDKTAKRLQLKLVLERAELGTSYRFARQFGSKSFIKLKLKLSRNNKYSSELFDYLVKPFVICGGVFRAFFAKDANIFLVKTNEIYDSSSGIIKESIPGVLPFSFLEFLGAYNMLDWDLSQTMAKWASRFALGLSNSAPGFLLDKNRLVLGCDIVSDAGSDMTDGAGTINKAGLLFLRHKFDWDATPSAVQVRIWGSKGLLVSDRGDKDDQPLVTLSPSQIKIHYPMADTSPDQANLIIDVLRSSHTRTPCRLSTEVIVNLSENGVPYSAFIQLLKQGLDELVQPLLNWSGPKAMQDLWITLQRMGGVMAARRAREEVGLARVKGLSERDFEEAENDDEDELQLNATEQRSFAWWGDECSGCPSGLEETVMYLLDSGFTPDNCFILRDKLEKIVKSRIKDYIKTYKINVPMSAIAFLVPDRHGVLEPGEVFFKCSRRHLRNYDGLETDLIVGDILLTRHPCKLPTDVQKWKAVDKPELHYLTDVIVCSTKGNRRAADFLAGGDYDGDKGTIIWQPELVKPFENAPLHFSEPPEDIGKTFQKKMKSTLSMSKERLIRALQRYLLGGIVRDTTVVGKYSTFHEHATYTLGYQDAETKRLAYMFCMILDGSKTGMTVLPEVLAQDVKKYNHRPPAWKETEEDRKCYFEQGRNDVNLKRPSSLGIFIMDKLHKQAEDEGKTRLGLIDATFEQKTRCSVDSDLTAPWRNAKVRSKRWITEGVAMQNELQKLEEHVKAVYTYHREALNRGGGGSSMKNGSKLAFTGLPIEVRQDKFRDLSMKFASYPSSGEFLSMSDEEVARVRASYAYLYDTEKNPYKFTRFPWDVAMRELTGIKARATGRHKTVAGIFYDDFNIKRSYI
ncbi:RNA dependent RNA polymerase-domain-containing protein [Cyathus striatus]|nr:RNA dependent RNA polymerase-domain-containing protein [Cyathus striatus]